MFKNLSETQNINIEAQKDFILFYRSSFEIKVFTSENNEANIFCRWKMGFLGFLFNKKELKNMNEIKRRIVQILEKQNFVVNEIQSININ